MPQWGADWVTQGRSGEGAGPEPGTGTPRGHAYNTGSVQSHGQEGSALGRAVGCSPPTQQGCS